MRMVKYLVQEETVHLYLYDFHLSYSEVHHTTLEKERDCSFSFS